MKITHKVVDDVESFGYDIEKGYIRHILYHDTKEYHTNREEVRVWRNRY